MQVGRSDRLSAGRRVVGTLTVRDVPGQDAATVQWSGSFTAVGVAEAEAVALFRGIHTDGLAVLRRALGAPAAS
ncbi:hypothetical protein GCM10018793_09630 [Streptomyces sulfonofaciens]|uniref:SRPBCC family protein n=1 Tax=Streptomyces sulfonofaciens TaxID=68272 RepID=A0A919FUB1_9ACTN|nr:hypothetical protein GCM10018793_09630 [Streptomyces sulfonofaciens]